MVSLSRLPYGQRPGLPGFSAILRVHRFTSRLPYGARSPIATPTANVSTLDAWLRGRAFRTTMVPVPASTEFLRVDFSFDVAPPLRLTSGSSVSITRGRLNVLGTLAWGATMKSRVVVMLLIRGMSGLRRRASPLRRTIRYLPAFEASVRVPQSTSRLPCGKRLGSSQERPPCESIHCRRARHPNGYSSWESHMLR